MNSLCENRCCGRREDVLTFCQSILPVWTSRIPGFRSAAHADLPREAGADGICAVRGAIG